MNLNAILKLIQAAGIGAMVVWMFVLYESNERNKSEKERFESNYIQVLQEKESMHQAYIVDRKELKRYLEIKDQNFLAKLDEMKIKLRKVNQIVKQTYTSTDTIRNTVVINPVLDSIYSGRSIKFPFTDSTSCIQSKGFVQFQNNNLSINFTERKVNDTVYLIKHEYRKWFLGRRHYKEDLISKCGNYNLVVINKKK